MTQAISLRIIDELLIQLMTLIVLKRSRDLYIAWLEEKIDFDVLLISFEAFFVKMID